jgi:hypothetical protein
MIKAMLIGLAISRVNISFCIMNDQVILLDGVWQCQVSQLAVTESNWLESIGNTTTQESIDGVQETKLK